MRWGFGAGVDRKNHEAFERRFGFPLIEAWAMTETGAAACVMANHEPRHVGTNCFGRPEPYMQYRLVDDQGRDVDGGAPGELLVRSAGADPRRYFFSGYLKDAVATDEAWAEGWFHTGDIVRRDADGSLYFVDRKKNVIRRSGENISAVEVESVLNQHPAVKAAAVAAAPDAMRGDEVMACVVTRDPVVRSATRRNRGEPRRACAGAARLLQGAGLRGVRRRAAADRVAEDPARRAARSGTRAAGSTELHRHAVDEEAAVNSPQRAPSSRAAASAGWCQSRQREAP